MVASLYATYVRFTNALVLSPEVCSAISCVGWICFVVEMSLHECWGLQDLVPVAAWTLARGLLQPHEQQSWFISCRLACRSAAMSQRGRSPLLGGCPQLLDAALVGDGSSAVAQIQVLPEISALEGLLLPALGMLFPSEGSRLPPAQWMDGWSTSRAWAGPPASTIGAFPGSSLCLGRLYECVMN